MKTERHVIDDSAQATLEESAAAWRVRLSTPSVSALERRAFEQWLESSPENRRNYESMDRAYDAAGAAAAEEAIVKMREAALRFQAPPRRRAMKWAASISATVIVAGGIWWGSGKLDIERPELPSRSRAASEGVARIESAAHGEYETRIGERSIIRLVDGSVVTLDTASRVSFQLEGTEREVHLLAGRANFDVAKDKTRPFVVYAADRRITAVGTAFDVRLTPSEVRVTLVEGKVAVDQLARDPKPRAHDAPTVRTQLDAGEQLIAPVGGAAKVLGANLERQTSWRAGRLIFEADRLSDAVGEMNRYSNIPIVLADPAIGDLKVSGVFGTANPKSFTRALTQYFNIDADERDNATVLRWRH
jgi:transmembrane sensor